MRCVSSTWSFSVDNIPWSGKQRVFVVKYTLRTTLGLGRHDPARSCKIINCCVDNFNETGSTEDKKRSGRPLTVRTPENVETVRNSFLKFIVLRRNMQAPLVYQSEQWDQFYIMTLNFIYTKRLKSRNCYPRTMKLQWRAVKGYWTWCRLVHFCLRATKFIFTGVKLWTSKIWVTEHLKTFTRFIKVLFAV